MSNKICAICGDKAIGYNFGVISCVSCKAFFRRNASKVGTLKCYLGDNCTIDVLSRKSCKKCRLKRCFDLGMNKDLILSDYEKQVYKKYQNYDKNIENNLNKYQTETNSDWSTEESESNACNNQIVCENELLIQNLENYNISEDEIIQEMNKIETYCQSDYVSKKMFLEINHNSRFNTDLSVVPIDRPISDYTNNLTELEGNRLTELLNASNVFKTSENFGYIGNNAITLETTDNINAFKIFSTKSEQLIELLVKLSNKLSLFRQNCENDQIALIKYSVPDVIIINLLRCFDAEQMNWVINTSPKFSVILRQDVLKIKSDLYKHHKKYYNMVVTENDPDGVIPFLLLAIILFNPNQPNILNKHAIEFERRVYMHLLKRFLLLKYRSESESMSRFVQLMTGLNELYSLAQLLKTRVKEVSEQMHDLIGPILKETYDII